MVELAYSRSWAALAEKKRGDCSACQQNALAVGTMALQHAWVSAGLCDGADALIVEVVAVSLV